MNAVAEIFIAVSLIFGGGFAVERIFVNVKAAAVAKVQHGMPSLEAFTNRLTCSRISKTGVLMHSACGIPTNLEGLKLNGKSGHPKEMARKVSKSNKEKTNNQ